MLQFFVHAINNLGFWPQVLSRIQAIINNTSFSLTGKIINKVTYNFFPHRLLDLLAVLFTPNTLAALTDVAEVVSFTLLNQKVIYNWKH